MTDGKPKFSLHAAMHCVHKDRPRRGTSSVVLSTQIDATPPFIIPGNRMRRRSLAPFLAASLVGILAIASPCKAQTDADEIKELRARAANAEMSLGTALCTLETARTALENGDCERAAEVLGVKAGGDGKPRQAGSQAAPERVLGRQVANFVVVVREVQKFGLTETEESDRDAKAAVAKQQATTAAVAKRKYDEMLRKNKADKDHYDIRWPNRFDPDRPPFDPTYSSVDLRKQKGAIATAERRARQASAFVESMRRLENSGRRILVGYMESPNPGEPDIRVRARCLKRGPAGAAASLVTGDRVRVRGKITDSDSNLRVIEVSKLDLAMEPKPNSGDSPARP